MVSWFICPPRLISQEARLAKRYSSRGRRIIGFIEVYGDAIEVLMREWFL